MTQRLSVAADQSRHGFSPAGALCDPLEAAARVTVLTVLVYGSIYLAIDSVWYAVGWIGPVGLRLFWALALIGAMPTLLLFWFTRLPHLRLAAISGGITAAVFILRLGLLPAMGFGSFPRAAFPIQVVGPPVYCLAAFVGALLTCWLARLARADLRRP